MNSRLAFSWFLYAKRLYHWRSLHGETLVLHRYKYSRTWGCLVLLKYYVSIPLELGLAHFYNRKRTWRKKKSCYKSYQLNKEERRRKTAILDCSLSLFIYFSWHSHINVQNYWFCFMLFTMNRDYLKLEWLIKCKLHWHKRAAFSYIFSK